MNAVCTTHPRRAAADHKSGVDDDKSAPPTRQYQPFHEIAQANKRKFAFDGALEFFFRSHRHHRRARTRARAPAAASRAQQQRWRCANSSVRTATPRARGRVFMLRHHTQPAVARSPARRGLSAGARSCMFCSALPARSATVAPALRLHQRRSSSTRSAARVVSMAGGPVVKRWKVDAAAEARALHRSHPRRYACRRVEGCSPTQASPRRAGVHRHLLARPGCPGQVPDGQRPEVASQRVYL